MSDLIFGMHSIAEAINNPKRENLSLYATEDSLKELRKLHFKGSNIPDHCQLLLFSIHKLKEEGRIVLKEKDFKDQRVPSNIFLIAEELETADINDFYNAAETFDNFKALILDQVTDVHNLGAILRTAAFYNIDFVIYGKKGDENKSPGFFRVASGAAEFTPLIPAPNLNKVVRKLMDMGVQCVGLAEEEENSSLNLDQAKICLVMGAEETGISHALRRTLNDFVSLPPKGPIKSLNVSVAAALAMEKFLN
jgi:23S rRNA (guanosine2251-2'-O)-methyltransferase